MERERLDQEIIDAWDGDPWHGSPITAILEGIDAAHDELRRVIKKLSDEAIMAPPGVPRDRATGTGTTIYRLVHGLVQHDAYHAGQISLLKKMT